MDCIQDFTNRTISVNEVGALNCNCYTSPEFPPSPQKIDSSPPKKKFSPKIAPSSPYSPLPKLQGMVPPLCQ